VLGMVHLSEVLGRYEAYRGSSGRQQ
jgi:hypothetical protein